MSQQASDVGQYPTSYRAGAMSAWRPTADISGLWQEVRVGPEADSDASFDQDAKPTSDREWQMVGFW